MGNVQMMPCPQLKTVRIFYSALALASLGGTAVGPEEYKEIFWGAKDVAPW